MTDLNQERLFRPQEGYDSLETLLQQMLAFRQSSNVKALEKGPCAAGRSDAQCWFSQIAKYLENCVARQVARLRFATRGRNHAL